MKQSMKVSSLLSKLSIFCVIVMLLSMPLSRAFADDTQPPATDTSSSYETKTVPPDPNRVLSPEEKALRDTKYRRLKQFLPSKGVSKYGGLPSALTLAVGTWKEPNTRAYVNHCGPGATLVALDARWPAASVYKIDRIATDEKTNVGKIGTAMEDIVKALNSKTYLGGEFPNKNGMDRYWWDGVKNGDTQYDFFDKVAFDITRGYVFISGVNTRGMYGWNHPADHIVAVIGYKVVGLNTLYVTYVETSAAAAGFTGNYRNTVQLENFYKYFSALPTMAW